MKQTILIAEDEPINRLILKKLLKDRYNILEAEDGAQAWQLITWRRTEIYAVLLDIRMPVMNGFDLLNKIHEANIDDLPVIVTTGVSEEYIEEKALDAGAWDFVPKPYNPNVLMSRLRGAIARSQLSAFEKSKYLLEHDEFTGFYNRRKMFSEVRAMLDLDKDTKYAFIRIDINHFALYNTSFGEKEGDKLIKYLADCIEDISKQYKNCVCGRMNADVFCICVDYQNNENCIIDNINLVQKKMTEYRRDYPLDIAAGIYIINDNTNNAEDYLYRAAVASQNCKLMYKSCYCFYDVMIDKSLEKDIAITNYMQSALDEEQFVIYFQPKIVISTGDYCGSEALVRWIHPERGFISPGEFIPLFEKNGFISKLDYYVWEHTCMKLHEWREAGKETKPVSVNISRISLYNPQLTELMKGLVKKYEIPPELLELEITESAYMTNRKLMKNTIESLREAGFKILMDDFGSGYSSLNTLKSIQVDVLKIDMMFLPIEGEAERGEIILTSVIRMARWLGMNVIVEGVETRMQRDFLEGIGCEYVQGYYYAKPMSSDEYERLYIDNSVKGNNNQADVSCTNDKSECNASILVIDDSEIDRTIINENLNKLYTVHECENAEQGLAYLQNNIDKVRLILVDNLLPGMSGMEFLRYCQQESSLDVIPKIMITSEENEDVQVEAFSVGAYDYITKPLTKEIIIARVKHVMDVSSGISVFDLVEKSYENSSEQDFSTSLFNKLAFSSISTRILRSMPDTLEALLIIEIDSFESLENSYGKLVGESVIHLIEEVLKCVFSKADVIGRFNSDRFAVMMTKLTSREIVKYKAEAVKNSVLLHSIKEMGVDISVGIGITFSDVNDNINNMTCKAEEALCEAKREGKARIVVYGDAIKAVEDGSGPIVVICGNDLEVFNEISLAFGEFASFTYVKCIEDLKDIFKRYPERISTVCFDMQNNHLYDFELMYEYVSENGGGDVIPVVAIYSEGNMDQLGQALKMRLYDIITYPPHLNAVQRSLSRCILHSSLQRKKTRGANDGQKS